MGYSIYHVAADAPEVDSSGNAMSAVRPPRLHFTRQKSIFEFDCETVEGLLAAIPGSGQTSPLAVALKRYLFGSSTGNIREIRSLPELDELWKGADRQTRCRLLENRDFLWVLSEKQAEDICACPDTEMLASLYKVMCCTGHGILPASPRLSTASRLKLIKLAMVAHDSGTENMAGLESRIREYISVDAAEDIFTHEFPKDIALEALKECFLPVGCAYGSALGLARAPLESALFGIVQRHVWDKDSVLATYALQLRQGKWERLVLSIGSDEFELGLADIALICDYCDLENACLEFITSLFQIGHPEITKRILWSGLLTRAQADEAWEQGNIGVCRRLLHFPLFLYGMTDSQAEDIIAVNDAHLLQSLACRLKYLYEEWNDIPDRRLSVHMRDRLLQFLISHPDKDVKRLIGIYGRNLAPADSD